MESQINKTENKTTKGGKPFILFLVGLIALIIISKFVIGLFT